MKALTGAGAGIIERRAAAKYLDSVIAPRKLRDATRWAIVTIDAGAACWTLGSPMKSPAFRPF
jgi:hypothetical protein